MNKDSYVKIQHYLKVWGINTPARFSFSLSENNKEKARNEVLLFLESNKDCLFYFGEEDHEIASDEVLKRLDENIENQIIVEVALKYEKKGKGFSRANTSPLASVWIECNEGCAYRFSYQLDLLEKTGDKKVILSSKEQRKIAEIILLLEMNLKSIIQLEWGVTGDAIWITRVSIISSEMNDIKTYVDSSLSDNYSGVSSPLTFSLVKNIYGQVLKEASRTMNFSASRQKHLENSIPNLVNHIDWHLYYNIESYYTVLGNLPFGEKSILEWHAKIGGEIFGWNYKNYLLKYGKIEMLQTLWGMGRIIFKQEQVFKGFLTNLKDHEQTIKNEIDNIIQPEIGWELLGSLMKRPLGLGLALINDLFIVAGLRVLTDILSKKGYKKSDLPLLLKTDLELLALRPIEAMNHLKRKINQKSWDILVQESDNENWSAPYDPIFQKLRDNGEGVFAKELETFLKLHGERSFEELKLESLSLSQNPKLLVKLLDSFYGDKNPYTGISSKPVAIVLSFWQNWILQFTRRSLDWREVARHNRANLFQLFRTLVIKNAEMMKKNDPQFSEFTLRDFFSLTIDEWIAWSKQQLSDQDVMSLMKQREEWKQLERSYPEVYFQAEGDKFYNYNIIREKEFMLKGVGASPGEVTGVALVLQHPEEAFMIKNLEERILIAKNTNPTWVYIMVRAKGLVSEKGSILSHAAIIGRELKLPTVVNAINITNTIKTGDKITINGTSGEIFRH